MQLIRDVDRLVALLRSVEHVFLVSQRFKSVLLARSKPERHRKLSFDKNEEPKKRLAIVITMMIRGQSEITAADYNATSTVRDNLTSTEHGVFSNSL